MPRKQRTDPEGRDPSDSAGQTCDPESDGDHPVDALAHQPPQQAIEAERERNNAIRPAGITQSDTIGMANRFASTP